MLCKMKFQQVFCVRCQQKPFDSMHLAVFNIDVKMRSGIVSYAFYAELLSLIFLHYFLLLEHFREIKQMYIQVDIMTAYRSEYAL